MRLQDGKPQFRAQLSAPWHACAPVTKNVLAPSRSSLSPLPLFTLCYVMSIPRVGSIGTTHRTATQRDAGTQIPRAHALAHVVGSGVGVGRRPNLFTRNRHPFVCSCGPPRVARGRMRSTPALALAFPSTDVRSLILEPSHLLH